MTNKRILALLLLLALVAGVFIYKKFRVAPSIDFSKLSLSDMNGNAVNFNSFKGRKLVVCFSATWCGNCWEELRDIDKMKDTELGDVEFVVISDEPVERIAIFGQKLKGPFTYLKLNTDFPSIGINSIPVSYIFNSKFEIEKEHVGYIDWKDPSTREHLKKLME
jgi:hypothetical protein